MNVQPKIMLKENIYRLNFPFEEVLESQELIKKRRSFIQTSLKLGNNYKRKVKIVFEDEESVKAVETTVWAVTDKNLALKGGQLIPIHRIHRIDLF